MNVERKKRIRLMIIAVSAVLLLSLGTGVAFSYIAKETTPEENIFTPGKVECTVNEVFDGVEKSNVSIKNTGNTPSYIRVALIITWQSETERSETYAKKPEEGEDYKVTFGDPLWVKGDDGYWYYTEPVLPNADTKALIETISPLGNAPEGYMLSVEILASAIQADPISVVEAEWGVSSMGNMIVP